MRDRTQSETRQAHGSGRDSAQLQQRRDARRRPRRLRRLTRVRGRGRGRGHAARSGPAASGPASVCTASPGASGAGPARRRGRAPRRTSAVTMLPLSAVEGKDTEEVKTTPPEKGGRTSAVTMLPLSTVEGEDTEEVKTKPPEKGALLSENTEDPPKKRSRMKGRMSLKILPFCPLPSFCFTYYLEPDDSDSDSEAAPEPLKPDSNCTVIPIVGLDFKEIKEFQSVRVREKHCVWKPSTNISILSNHQQLDPQ
ncbi:uncharacterized protein [Vicugna pacos]|uniref:Uncharacterized protein n=1 Tax=Vicugna pacos TaxID=30538 RepID=A0ABM5DVN1_VICPA